MYGYALMCSPTMRDFFDFAVRYQPLATPTVRLGWRTEGEVAIWQFSEIYRDVMSSEVRKFLVRQQMKMRSEEHTSELWSLMSISYAVLRLKNKKTTSTTRSHNRYMT